MSEFNQNISNLESRLDRKLNFLEAHYIKYMEVGGDHAEYVVCNDIDDLEKLCDQLKVTYQKYKENKGEEDAD